MSVEQVALLTVLAIAAAFAVGRIRPRLFSALRKLSIWAGFLTVGVLTSGLSALVIREGISGTGNRRQAGWPKPFWTHWRSWEDSSVEVNFHAVQFAANSSFYAAVALSGFALFHLMRQ